jgi:L-methionine (R)-S-oxide reductase
MSEVTIRPDANPEDIIPQLEALLNDNEPPLTVMANMASLLYWSLDAINWVGFYLADGDVLRLGPFHGKPACTTIPVGEGVCGSAFVEQRSINVPDVEGFPGHIACDAASRSELVSPLLCDGVAYGVLDIDSPVHNRFGIAEERLFEAAAALLSAHLCKWQGRVFPT